MSEQKKLHIIQTAINLFAEKGYEGTSIRDLAKRANVNVAMVNYYFGSKEKLFEAVVETRAGDMRILLDEIRDNQQLTQLEKIELIIFHYVNRILDNRAFFQVMQQEMLVSSRPELNNNITSVIFRNVDEVVKIIHTGIRKKEFRKVDAQLTFASIIGTIQQIVMSKSLCIKMLHLPEHENPFEDIQVRNRLRKHIQQMMHAHLLPNTIKQNK